MKVCQSVRLNGVWSKCPHAGELNDPDLILCFGDRYTLTEKSSYQFLLQNYPNSHILISSTAGEISNDGIRDSTIVATGIKLERSKLETRMINIEDYADSFAAGLGLTTLFDREGMQLLFVISDGQLVNGSSLVEGLRAGLPDVLISGGLAGDGDNFQHTVVGLNEDVRSGNIVGVAFYGEHLNVGVGARGGWDKFGPPRTITKADQNILFEIDHENALELYKRYLGDYAERLPASALLFPLAIQESDEGDIVRTVLNVDTESQTMVFAGNIPNNAKVRMMRSNLDNLVTAASDAAELSLEPQPGHQAELAILVSCVGRKMIFGSRIEEELEAARDVLGRETVVAGFYSYGEIAPFSIGQNCLLHNQTITILTISEDMA